MPFRTSQHRSSYPITAFLGDLGGLPFALLALLMLRGFLGGDGLQSTAVFGLYAPYIFIAYSAVILSFLSGALWTTARFGETTRLSSSAIILSNLLALAAWSSLMMIFVAQIMTIFAVSLLSAGFIAVLWAERIMGAPAGEHHRGYWAMRLRVTGLVTLWHFMVICMMIQEL